jgi:general secretion pathway protein H
MKRPKAAGFTLIETVLVVALIGIVVAMVSVNLAARRDDALESDARALASRLGHAQDEAVVTGARLAWRGEARGYRFLRPGPDAWEALERDDALRPREWRAGVRLAAFERPGTANPEDAIIVFRASGMGEPYRVLLEDGTQRALIESDGLAPPRVSMTGAR